MRGDRDLSAEAFNEAAGIDDQYAAEMADALEQAEHVVEPDPWVDSVIALNLDPFQERLLIDLDGALLGLAEHIVKTAIRPQPWLALGASLAAIGALMGHRYRTETNLRSNLYVLNLAPSGAGKDHARQAIKEVFVKAGLEAYLGGERLASGAAIMSAMKRHPATLFQIDEFGKFAAVICDRKAPKHLIDIWDRLTELYTSAGGTWLGTEYADQKERPRESIVQPCACLHATSVPEPFWAALKGGSRYDGSLARFLLFQADDYPKTQYQPAAMSELPDGLVETLQAITHGDGQFGDLLASTVEPTVRTVPMTPEAREEWIKLDEEIREGLRNRPKDRAILSRWCEHTMKLAMISAVSAEPQNPVIDAERFKWAEELSYHCVEDLLWESAKEMADNDHERKKKMVLAKITEAGTDGILKRDLARKTQSLSNRERGDILSDLDEGDYIIMFKAGEDKKGHRTPIIIYEMQMWKRTKGKRQ